MKKSKAKKSPKPPLKKGDLKPTKKAGCNRQKKSIETPEPAKNNDLFSKLLPRQKAFVLSYLETFNATRAAKEAGYSAKTAFEMGAENLRKPKILLVINELLESVGITQERILKKFAKFTRGDIADYEGIFYGKTLKQLRKDGVDTSLIKKLKTKRLIVGKDEEQQEYEIIDFELIDPVRANKDLAEIIGMVKRRLELSAPGITKFVFDNSIEGEDDQVEDI